MDSSPLVPPGEPQIGFTSEKASKGKEDTAHSEQLEDKGEGDGTPLQYSCLENPMDGGAWWAAVHGVAKSQT